MFKIILRCAIPNFLSVKKEKYIRFPKSISLEKLGLQCMPDFFYPFNFQITLNAFQCLKLCNDEYDKMNEATRPKIPHTSSTCQTF